MKSYMADFMYRYNLSGTTRENCFGNLLEDVVPTIKFNLNVGDSRSNIYLSRYM